jgi:hypothetical protein
MNGRLALVILAAVVGYAIWAYNHPWRDCPRCKGSGRNRLSTKRRRGKCWRCKGTREVRTLGARMLHRAVRSARSSWRGRKEK